MEDNPILPVASLFAMKVNLGHLQRVAGAYRPHASELVQPDQRVGCALSSGTTHSDRRVWRDVSVHQIWVTNASTWTRADDARVLPRTPRARMAASQMGHDVAWRMNWPEVVARKPINVGPDADIGTRWLTRRC
jgi:hypothetical protein